MAILDGGLATELEARGHDLSDHLWSARLLVEDPGSIGQLHLDYLRAGADCIVSAGYQASLPGFARIGLDVAEAERMLRRAVRLAVSARDEFWSTAGNRAGRYRPLVASGVGPYGAFLADGSEYTGAYGLDAAGLARFHHRRLAVTAAAGGDLLACETIPSAVEAQVLAELLAELPGCRGWISFSCRDGKRICDGTPLARVVARLAGCPALIALGINCTAPRHLESLIGEARAQTELPLVVYPNSGESYDATGKAWSGDAGSWSLADAAPRWRELGAAVLGGCCRTGIDDIRRLRRRLLPGPQST